MIISFPLFVTLSLFLNDHETQYIAIIYRFLTMSLTSFGPW